MELQALHKYYDTDGDGNVSYDEFIRGLREPLNERKKKAVESVFKCLDSKNSGVVTVKDVIENFNVEGNKEVLSG